MVESSVATTVHPDRVEFALRVENAGEDPVELTFRSGLNAEFAVVDGEETVYRSSEGRLFTQALRTETIDPGDVETYTGTWTDPSPGEYTVVAELNVTGPDVRSRSDFSV